MAIGLLWLAIYWLTMGWLLVIHWLAISWLLAIYRLLAIGYIGWLLAGYLLAGYLSTGYQVHVHVWPKINTLPDIVIYYMYMYVPQLHMAASNTLDCSVFTRLFMYMYSHIHVPCTKVAYCCNKTLGCTHSVFTRFLVIGWLYVWPKTKT